MPINSQRNSSERDEPLETLPPPMPARILEALQSVKPPSLIYDLVQFRKSVRDVVEAFDEYHFPVKSNPAPEILKAAVEQGAGLDVCSPGEFELAVKTGVKSSLISHTGMALDSCLSARMNSMKVQVNLDSLQEVEQWLMDLPGSPVALRLKAGNDMRYLNKFGVGDAELALALQKIKAAKTSLAGIHAHFNHFSKTPDDLAKEYKPFLGRLTAFLKDEIFNLEYLNLGGGWPFFYEIPGKMDPCAFAKAMKEKIMAPLRDAGFNGKIIVEPGEFTVADCGYWAAEVAVLKRGSQDRKVAVLDTITPIPSAELPYPAAGFRRKNGKLEQAPGKTAEACDLVGASNSPFDIIRKSVFLPGLKIGDMIVFRRAGAYLETLMSDFNSRPAPDRHIVG